MLSHRMRLSRLDASVVEIETVEGAGRNADGNREYGEQYYDIPARKPTAFATKQIRFPHHLFRIY